MLTPQRQRCGLDFLSDQHHHHHHYLSTAMISASALTFVRVIPVSSPSSHSLLNTSVRCPVLSYLDYPYTSSSLPLIHLKRRTRISICRTRTSGRTGLDTQSCCTYTYISIHFKSTYEYLEMNCLHCSMSHATHLAFRISNGRLRAAYPAPSLPMSCHVRLVSSPVARPL